MPEDWPSVGHRGEPAFKGDHRAVLGGRDEGVHEALLLGTARGPCPGDEDGGVLPPCVRRVLVAAAVVLFAVGCGSGSGSANPSSSASRPSQAPTIPDATVRPPATDAPSGATDATEAPPAPTEAPTVAESVAPAPGPGTSPPASTSDEGSSPWWPWLLAALAVAAVVIGVFSLLRRSPKAAPAPSPAPTAPTAAVLAQSDEISTQLVGLAPARLGAVAGADAGSLAVLITIVEQLMTSAPDETSRRALVALHEPMRSLHSALDAIALTPHPPSDAEVAEVRSRATALHSATSLARATLLPPSPGPTV